MTSVATTPRAGRLALATTALLGAAGVLHIVRTPTGPTLVPVTVGPSLLPAAVARHRQLDETARRALDAAAYERRVTEDPRSAADWSMLAAIRLQQGRDAADADRFHAAEVAARRSLTLRQDRNTKTMLVLASALLAQHRFPEALAVADSMVIREPDRPGFRALQFELQVEMGRYDEARVTARLLARDRTDPAVAPRLARWHELTGHPDSARRLLLSAQHTADTARDLPLEQRAWYALRVIDFALRHGDLSAADTALRRARQRFPRDVRLAQAGVRLAALRHDAERVRTLADSLGTATDLATSALIGDVLLDHGDSAAAARWHARVEQLNRESPEPFARGWTLHRLVQAVDPTGTRALLEREIGVRQDVYGWDQLALARLATGDVPGARAASLRARALGTRDATLWWHAARIEQAAGNTDRARSLAAEALRINPVFHHRDADRARALVTSATTTAVRRAG